ncbi:efflux RND transporter periplasmic adaptor subunit [Engelhardtia mirabilis]|uniref:efflux RND transporter periplasmic adaptor subunit n=1 Tax=Engelhardtia mirabilis TaxID=2528011 RepID=UPI0011AB1ABC
MDRTLLVVLLSVVAWGCSSEIHEDLDHEGHEHAVGDDDHDHVAIGVTLFTDELGLYLEYPPLVAGVEARFLAHLTLLASGAPLADASVRLELSGDGGQQVTLVAERAEVPGIFIPAGAIEDPAIYAARLIVDGADVRATIPIEQVLVYPDEARAHAAAEAEEVEEPADVTHFLLEQQWRIGLRTEVVERRTLTERLRVPGVVEVPQGELAVVGAPFDGRLAAPESGDLPRIGERVVAGQVLGFLDPPLSIGDSAAAVANEASLRGLELDLMGRELDLEARSVDVEQARIRAQTRLEFARAALQRAETLRASDLGTESELAQKRMDVELASREIEGALALAESVERARARLDQLRADAAIATTAAEVPGRAPLVAPIDGEVVEVGHVRGEAVASQATIFRLMDLERVWLVANVSEFDLAAVGDDLGALLEIPAFPDRRFDVVADLNGGVVSVGREVQPGARTVALRFAADNPDGLLRAGMYVDLQLATGSAAEAVAVPTTAVVTESGQPIAFVLLDGETFQKRYLELGPRDGDLVSVRAGLEPGERVVTAGAYLLRLASASPAEFGHGHAH